MDDRYLQRPEEDISSSGTGVPDGYELLCAHWEVSWALLRRSQCSSPPSHLSNSSMASLSILSLLVCRKDTIFLNKNVNYVSFHFAESFFLIKSKNFSWSP